METFVYEQTVFYADSMFHFQNKVAKKEYMQLVKVIREKAEFRNWIDTVLSALTASEFYAVDRLFQRRPVKYVDKNNIEQDTVINSFLDFVIKCYDKNFEEFNRSVYRYNLGINLGMVYKAKCENKEIEDTFNTMISGCVKLDRIDYKGSLEEYKEFLQDLKKIAGCFTAGN